MFLVFDIGEYLVYSDGKVFSKKRRKFLKPWLNTTGYLKVKVGATETFLHRLVASIFIPNTLGLETVDHIDKDRLNNDYKNLRWMTREENASLGRIGTYTLISPTGEVVTFTGMSKFCEDNMLVSGNISKVLSGERLHHKGWKKEKECS